MTRPSLERYRSSSPTLSAVVLKRDLVSNNTSEQVVLWRDLVSSSTTQSTACRTGVLMWMKQLNLSQAKARQTSDEVHVSLAKLNRLNQPS